MNPQITPMDADSQGPMQESNREIREPREKGNFTPEDTAKPQAGPPGDLLLLTCRLSLITFFPCPSRWPPP